MQHVGQSTHAQFEPETLETRNPLIFKKTRGKSRICTISA